MRTNFLLCVFACSASFTALPRVDGQEAPKAAEAQRLDPLKQPGLKNFLDEVAKMIETLGHGDVDAVIARVGELGIGSPNSQELKRLEGAMGGLRKLPPQKFERLEVTSVKSLSTRLHVFSFIAHGRFRPFLFLVVIDQYEQKWRMIHIHFSNDQQNVLKQAPALQGGKPILSYDLTPDTVAKVD